MSRQTDAIKYAVDSGKYKVDTLTGTIYGPRGHVLKPAITDPNPTKNRKVDFSGYYVISLYISTYKWPISVPVHKIVAYVAYGDIALKKGLHIDHINRNSLDNRAENLRVVTPKQNAANRPIVDMHKLTQEDITDITNMLVQGYDLLDVAGSYDVHPLTIYNALKGKSAYNTFNVPDATPTQLGMSNFWKDVDNGMKKRQLREKYGLSHTTLSRRLSRQSGRL